MPCGQSHAIDLTAVPCPEFPPSSVTAICGKAVKASYGPVDEFLGYGPYPGIKFFAISQQHAEHVLAENHYVWMENSSLRKFPVSLFSYQMAEYKSISDESGNFFMPVPPDSYIVCSTISTACTYLLMEESKTSKILFTDPVFMSGQPYFQDGHSPSNLKPSLRSQGGI